MPADFMWQTEDEKWDQEPLVSEEGERPKRRWWPRLLIGLAVMVGLGALIYWQVRQQLDAAVARAENDVRRTHELVLQAAGSQDRDLLTSVASGRDDAWLNNLLELTDAGLLYNATLFGLHAQQDNDPQYDFKLSADLTEAAVTTTRSFTVQSLTGVSETVDLNQYAIYRQGNDRWLYSPPEDPETYWQDAKTEEGQYLSITYPMRDAEQVAPLFQYLDGKLAEMCTSLPDFSCPEGFQIQLGLSTSLHDQLPLLDPRNLFLDNPSLTLPTPTLVGQPVDEAAREALYRGYAAHVIRAGMIRALGWECCQNGLYFRALVDYQLAQLDIAPYPLYPADYEKLFGRFWPLEVIEESWGSRRNELALDGDWRWTYALTEFVLSSPFGNTTAGALQQRLVTAGSFAEWLDGALTEPLGSVSLRHAWLNFVYGRSLSGQVAAGTFAPDQDILLACDNGATQRSAFYRYEWGTEAWRLVDEFGDSTYFVTSMPDDAAVIVQQRNYQSPTSTFLWQDGVSTPLYIGPGEWEGGYYFFGLVSPDGRSLVMTRPWPDDGYMLLDVNNCSATGCTLSPVPGRPSWSPGGDRMLVELIEIRTPSRTFYRGLVKFRPDGRTFLVAERGFSPFWFSEDEYGFVALEPEPSLFSSPAADDQDHLLLTAVDLLQAIPESERPDSLTIWQAAPNPANRNLLAVNGQNIDITTNADYQFLWNRRTGEISLISTMEQANVGGSSWLNNGEWLVVPTFGFQSTGDAGEALPWTYYLYHVSGEGSPITIAREGALAYPSLDQSLNGDWLVMPHVNYLEVVALRHTVGNNQPYRRMLAHDFESCRNALFIW